MAESEEVRAARRALGRLLARYRRAAGLSQHQLAPRAHYGRSTIANVEVGRQNVPRSFWERADAVLGAGGKLTAQYDELVLLIHRQRREIAEAEAARWGMIHEEDGSARGAVELCGHEELAAAVAPRPSEVYSVCSAAQEYQEVSPVPTRREVFGYLGASLTAIGFEQVTTRTPRVVEALAATHLTGASEAAILDSLHIIVQHYRRIFRQTSPLALYDELLGVRVHAAGLVDRIPAEKRRDLTVAVGWLSNLLALVTHDLDDRAASLVWCADAERRSQEARHPELAGWSAQTKVLMSFYDGRARDAVALAQRGQQLAPLGTVAHAKLLTHEMRAWALLGNADQVASTRRRAEQAIALLPTDRLPQGAFSISLADDPPYTATALLLLGKYQEAVAATRRVIATFYGPATEEGYGGHPSGFARTYLVLALALAKLGKLDEAVVAGCQALEAPRLVRPVNVLASGLDQVLIQGFPDTAEARDYHERYLAVVRGSTTGQSSSSGLPS